MPGDNYTPKPRFSRARWYVNALRGFYAQQHAPIREQTVPVGHSVRWGYLETAIAMILRARPDDALLHTLEQSWERMVTRRMYITGGLGAVPGLEGFGSDYELDPEYAYAETCASIASLLWDWEMALLTNKPQYSDLFEWQLYNATNVGMGENGDTYLYNNPLEVHHGVTRQGWYIVPCCPSNLSRTFADLGKYIFPSKATIYGSINTISSETTVDMGVPSKLHIESGMPWSGKVRIHIRPEKEKEFTVHLRIPSWNDGTSSDSQTTASGYDPRLARYETICRMWSPESDPVEFEFDMSIRLRQADPKVKGHEGKVAVTRGPLVYCLESVDQSRCRHLHRSAGSSFPAR